MYSFRCLAVEPLFAKLHPKKKGRVFMLKKYLKHKFIAAVTALCVICTAACGGGKEEKEAGNPIDNTGSADNTSGNINLETGIYTFEETAIHQGTENQDIITSNYFLKDGDLYYMYYMFPEYPEEYYDDLKKLDEMLSDEDSGIMPLGKDSDDTSVDTSSSDTGSKKDKPDYDNPDDVSDDELTGDLDDLFGDSEPDDAEATDKPDDSKTDDASGTDIKTYEDLEEKYKDYKPIQKLCKYNIETKEVSDVYDFTEVEDVQISKYCIDDDNRLVMLQEKYDENMKKSGEPAFKCFIVIKDAEGKDISNTEISDIIIGDRGNSSDEDFYISESMFGPDGYLYVSYVLQENNNTAISRIKTDGTLDGRVTVDNYVDSMSIDNNGKIVIGCYNEDKLVYSYLDFDKETIGEELEGLDGENTFVNLMPGRGDITFFLRDATALYKYNGETKEMTMILKWLDSGVIGDGVEYLMPIGDGRLFCTYNDSNGNSKTGILTKSEESGTEKKVIKVSSIYVNSSLQEKIIAFNKANSEYKIEYVTYETQENPETAFANDIIAGNIPDVIDVSSIDVNNYINKGILEDLTPYLEKDDTVNKDFFVDGVLNATAVDGKTYYLVKEFGLRTLAGKESDLKDYKDGWTIQELIEYYNSKPAGTELSDDCTRSGVLYHLVCSNLDNYIDWKTGEVKFDTDEFRTALEFCNKFAKDYEEDSETQVYKKIKEGKRVLNSIYLSDFTNIQVFRQLFDNDIKYIGYPTNDKCGTYLNPVNDTLAMTTVCENKDAVWEFIKSAVTKKDRYWSGIPASKTYFEEFVKQQTATEEYVDENGETVNPVDGTYGWNDFEVKIKPSSQEDIQFVKDLIKKSKAKIYNYDISAMIEEEAEKYFEGSKKLDDIVKIIQDKLSKYVNENK